MENIKRRIEELKEEIYDLEFEIENTTSTGDSIKVSNHINNLWEEIYLLEDQLSAAIEEAEEEEAAEEE